MVIVRQRLAISMALILGATFISATPVYAAPARPLIEHVAMERALHRLKIPTGKVDGVFDGQTQRALCIWRELTGGVINRKLPTDAEVVAATYTQELFPSTKMRIGLNINLACQSATWIQESVAEPIKIFKVSSGKATFETTPGKFTVGWLIDDWYESRTYPEGWMYRPQFFNKGQALHGSLTDTMVRWYPASHGCVRMLQEDVDFLWSAGLGRDSAINVYSRWRN